MNGILRTANRFDRILRKDRIKRAGILSDVGHITLDLIGLIPGVGEIADVSNALWFCKEGEWLFAALSIISAIPELGDVIGKGGKVVAWITKYLGKTGEIIVKYGPKVARAILKLKRLITAFRSQIDKILDKAEESKYFKDYVPYMRKALDVFSHEDVDEDGDKDSDDEDEEDPDLEDSVEPTKTSEPTKSSPEKTIKDVEKAAYMNTRILKLANRFERILKKANGPQVSMQLADAQDILAPTVGVTIEGGTATINNNAQIIKDINAVMDKYQIQNLKGSIKIGTNKTVTFITDADAVTKMLNTKYSAKCTQLLKADKRNVLEDLIWKNWLTY